MAAQPDLPNLYRSMCRIRYLEQAAAQLWHEGLISGEMHLGVGEEAVAAGVVAHLGDGDALAVDHRSTPAFVARGVDPEAILRELLGAPGGLDGGRAGHMHLMSPEHRVAASGIVGSAGPLACGFALAAAYRTDGEVAVAFFGDGALNEGMLMEAFNLAAAWRLPVVFVCKDNGWSINTRTRAVTGGSPRARAAGFGIPARSVDGADVVAVWQAAGRAVRRARHGGGPGVLVARVSRPEGHFLGDRLLALTRDPHAMAPELRPMLSALRASGGAAAPARMHSLERLLRTVGTLGAGRLRGDPLVRARRRLHPATADLVEQDTRAEIDEALRRARTGMVTSDA
jgi:pyruvate dehydrogenase E1 component alpha subunit